MHRIAPLAAAVTLAASMFLGTHAAHAQQRDATSYGVSRTPGSLSLSAELGHLKARREAIDFSGPHWLLGLGVATGAATAVFGIAAMVVAVFEGGVNLFTGSSYHSENVPAELALGTSLTSLALYLGSAIWCIALNVERGSIDSRIRDIGVSFGIAPMQSGFSAAAVIKL